MRKQIGLVVFVVGLLGAAYFGYKAYDQQKSVSAFGQKITVKKQGSYNEAMMMGGIAILGLVIAFLPNKK